jgi:hypothetical protein
MQKAYITKDKKLGSIVFEILCHKKGSKQRCKKQKHLV